MIQTLQFSIGEVKPYINWLYFFHAWGFPSRLGAASKVCGCVACRENWLNRLCSDHRELDRARQALQLFDDAQRLLHRLDGRYQTYARVAILPAYSDGDDIVVQGDNSSQSTNPKQGWKRLPLLRQQQAGNDGYCLCLSDFIAPSGKTTDGIGNNIGLFACCADPEMERLYGDDPYQHLLCQTLADRLAEATAERTHQLVRTTLWGYAPDEDLTPHELFTEQYQGRRPAVGYPSLPDQSFNFLLDDIIQFSTIGISLTESGAMQPHASTSGLMLAHPATRHFAVGPIQSDQLADYAHRRGMPVDTVRRFLSANI